MDTNKGFEMIIGECRHVFALKMKDYGPSWRIMRPQTVNDQLYIKAKRIRTIETTGENRVGDSIRGELMAIINYSIIGLIQLEHRYADHVDMDSETALKLYDNYAKKAWELLQNKNHDYGEAWREMESTSLTDIILTKINRNKEIAAKGEQTLISEGSDGNYYDMLNYAVFALIQMME